MDKRLHSAKKFVVMVKDLKSIVMMEIQKVEMVVAKTAKFKKDIHVKVGLQLNQVSVFPLLLLDHS